MLPQELGGDTNTIEEMHGTQSQVLITVTKK